jgi:hypothetical protein
MPQTLAYIGYIIADFIVPAAATTETFLAVADTIYAIELMVIASAVQGAMNRGKTGETRGLEVSLTDSTADARVIYGEVRTGGINMLPPYTSGTSGNILHQVLALAMHQIDTCNAVYFDQELLGTLTAITGSGNDGKVTTGTYANVAWARCYPGTMTQTVDYILTTNFPSQWTSTARGRGCAYLALSYDWGNGKVYKRVPQVTALIAGALVYDPRLDSTNGGSGSQRYTDSTTWKWSNNPALCWANYKISNYGFGVDPASDINWPAVITAANICDAIVDTYDPFLAGGYSVTGTGLKSGNTLSKTGANGSWTDGVYSNTAVGSCTISASAPSGNSVWQIGLHTTTGATLDSAYNWYVHSGLNQAYIRLGGSTVVTVTISNSPLEIFGIVYDGSTVRWTYNGKTLYSVSVAVTGTPYYFTSIFYYVSPYTMQIACAKRYTCNGILQNSIGSLRDNEKKLIDAMAGKFTFVNGVWNCYAGAWIAPDFTINQNDWLSITNLRTVAPRDGGRFNQAHCFYVDPTRNWQRVECYPRKNATYKTNDGGELIDLEMEQPMCTNEGEAQRKAEFILRTSRNGVQITGILPPRFQKLWTFGTVYVNFPALTYTLKTFRVTLMELLADGSVRVVLTEEQSTDWNDLTTASDYSAPSTALIPPKNPTAPSEAVLTVSNNINGTLTFALADPTVRPANTRFQIIRSTVSSNAAAGVIIYDGLTQNVDLPCPGSTQYYFSRAYANSVFGPYSPNSNGIAAIPSNVISVNQQTTFTDSLGLANAQVFAVTSFTPTFDGNLNGVLTMDGNAIYDKDSGTYMSMICMPASYYSGSPPTCNATSAAAFGGYKGGFYGFQVGSRHQQLVFNGLWQVNSGVSYVVGAQAFYSLGGINHYGSTLVAQLTRR